MEDFPFSKKYIFESTTFSVKKLQEFCDRNHLQCFFVIFLNQTKLNSMNNNDKTDMKQCVRRLNQNKVNIMKGPITTDALVD